MGHSVQEQLAAITLEVCDLLSLQRYGRRLYAVDDPNNQNAIMAEAQATIDNWHEYHEFVPEAFANPELMRALLTMYSDMLASYHEAELVTAERYAQPD